MQTLTEADQELRVLMREMDRRIAVRSFYSFVKQAWHIVEPKVPFVDGFHVEAICDHCQAVAEGEIPQLIINVPPRHMKSTIGSVMLTAWVWLRFPERRFLYASYSHVLAKRDSVKTRRLVESEWYRSLFNINWKLAADQNEKMRFDNTRNGARLSVSVGGSTTGEGGDVLVVDDPINAVDAHSETKRENCITWFDEAFSSRGNNPKKLGKIVIMQRLHENDLTGHLLEKGDWAHLVLPAEFEEAQPPTPIGWVDPRKAPGELLWPERFGALELAALKKAIGPGSAPGQLQQRPTPASGAIFKDRMIVFGKCPAVEEMDYTFVMADTAYNDKKENDFTVFTAFGVIKEQLYVLAVFRQQIKAADIEAPASAFIQFYTRYKFRGCYIEPKGHGIYLNQNLPRKGIMVASEEQLKEFYKDRNKDKTERANNAVPWLGYRHVIINDQIPEHEYLKHEAMVFPKGKHDDFVDTLIDGIKFVFARQASILDVL